MRGGGGHLGSPLGRNVGCNYLNKIFSSLHPNIWAGVVVLHFLKYYIRGTAFRVALLAASHCYS